MRGRRGGGKRSEAGIHKAAQLELGLGAPLPPGQQGLRTLASSLGLVGVGKSLGLKSWVLYKQPGLGSRSLPELSHQTGPTQGKATEAFRSRLPPQIWHLPCLATCLSWILNNTPTPPTSPAIHQAHAAEPLLETTGLHPRWLGRVGEHVIMDVFFLPCLECRQWKKLSLLGDHGGVCVQQVT